MQHRIHAGRLLALGLLLLASTLPARAALFDKAATNLQAEAKAAGAQGKRLAIFLTLPDCPGCQEMERSVFNNPKLGASFARHFRGVRLDIQEAGTIIDLAGRSVTTADFARRLRAVGTPSFAFFDGRGQTLYRYTGTLDTTGFAQLARFVEHEEYEQRPFTPPARKPSEQALFADPPGLTLPRQPEFELLATDGKTHQLTDFRGLAVALAVGYTTCPDVCPTTLVELKAAVEALPTRRRDKVQLLFATLDPERDSLSILKQYASAFRPTGGRPILGLRGNPAQTAKLIRQLQLVADKQPSASMGYTLDHTAGVFLFDGQGRLLGLSPYGQPVEKLANDLSHLASKLTSTIAKNQ